MVQNLATQNKHKADVIIDLLSRMFAETAPLFLG
jgi:hypothetical protein